MEEAEYSRMAAVEDRHWWYAALHDLVMRFASREANRTGRPLRILDAGCGTGRLCELLARFGDVTGCDIHPAAVEASTCRGVPRVLLQDLSEGRLGEDAFDLITMMDVLYHRRVSGELTVLRNLHRALSPGGTLIMQVPAFESLRGSHDVAVHTRRRYRRRQVARMLGGAGFSVETATYRLCALFVPVFACRLLSRARTRGGSAPPSDIAKIPSAPVNSLLLRMSLLENSLVARGARLPFGTSVFAVARKP